MTKERRLGRGLAALLGTPVEGEAEHDSESPDTLPIRENISTASQDKHDEQESDPQPQVEDGEAHTELKLNVYEIDVNPFQPRRDFSESEIASLAESLKSHDMLQPVLVRRAGERYELISGERRLRAAIQAGWSTIPARLREADDRLVSELAIVENLQRQDLNPIERALAFKRYIEEHSCTQDELAGRIKADRSTIANVMRLLELPEPVQVALRTGKVSAGHARALLPLGDESLQLQFCESIIDQGLSVRDTERLVKEKVAQEDAEPLTTKPTAKARKNEQVEQLEQELRRALGSKVEIKTGRGERGKIIIHFGNHDEFERIRQYLSDEAETEMRRAG